MILILVTLSRWLIPGTFKDKEDVIRGKIVSRIPEADWNDQPYTAGIELVT